MGAPRRARGRDAVHFPVGMRTPLDLFRRVSANPERFFQGKGAKTGGWGKTDDFAGRGLGRRLGAGRL